jgi:hypothetical protein
MFSDVRFGEPCVVVCQLAAVVCGYGQSSQNCKPPEAGGWDRYTAANHAVVLLSSDALAKLLQLVRNTAVDVGPSTAGDSSSNIASIPMKSCQLILPMLAQAVYTAAQLQLISPEIYPAGAISSQFGAEFGWGAVLQLHVQHS